MQPSCMEQMLDAPFRTLVFSLSWVPSILHSIKTLKSECSQSGFNIVHHHSTYVTPSEGWQLKRRPFIVPSLHTTKQGLDWRKGKKSEWAAYGAASTIRAGKMCAVSFRKDICTMLSDILSCSIHKNRCPKGRLVAATDSTQGCIREEILSI